MKVLNLLLAALFLLFAFVQINDPDPALWILIYGLMAVACILAAFGRYYPKIISILLIIYLAYSFFYISGVIIDLMLQGYVGRHYAVLHTRIRCACCDCIATTTDA